MGKLSTYLRFIKKEKSKFSNVSFWGLLKYYKPWTESVNEKNNKNSELPWMTFGAINFLKEQAAENMQVFEYGSGSSTLFWANRVKYVYSIEHDLDWSKKVKLDLDNRKINNVDLKYIKPEKRTESIQKDVADPYQYSTDDQQWKDYSFEKYVRTIESFPDATFDFVVVDGRARPSCIAASLAKIKIGGYLVVDNSERDYYFTKTLPLLPGDTWRRKDFCGPVPGLRHFHQTSFFKRIK